MPGRGRPKRGKDGVSPGQKESERWSEGYERVAGMAKTLHGARLVKNGCKVEALELSAIDRIERALALFMVVAWRVIYLMRMGSTCPISMPRCSSIPMKFVAPIC